MNSVKIKAYEYVEKNNGQISDIKVFEDGYSEGVNDAVLQSELIKALNKLATEASDLINGKTRMYYDHYSSIHMEDHNRKQVNSRLIKWTNIKQAVNFLVEESLLEGK